MLAGGIHRREIQILQKLSQNPRRLGNFISMLSIAGSANLPV
jgi:hypothetical protein